VAFQRVFGEDFFSYYHREPEAARTFNRAMRSVSSEQVQACMRAYDFSGASHIVDIGGGLGTVLAQVCREYPSVRGTVFDVPSVAEAAKQYLADEGLAERCEVASGDFFSGVPSKGDMYLLKYILHDWDDTRSKKILENCHSALAGRDGKLIILEHV